MIFSNFCYFLNMRNVILFISHHCDESDLIAYNRLITELDNSIYDVVWCAPYNLTLDDTIKTVYRYDNEKVFKHGFVNPSYIVENYYIEHHNYDYYYVHEYDVAYTGNYNEFFTELDATDYDFIACYINTSKSGRWWQWWEYQKELCWNLFGKDQILLKSCVSFARLSNRLLAKIVEYSEERFNIIYELYWPTIAYIHNMKILALDHAESDKDYINEKYNLCFPQYYYFNVDIDYNSFTDERKLLLTKNTYTKQSTYD